MIQVIKQSPRVFLERKLYTFGYGNRKNLETLLAHCHEKGINLLVDVRKNPKGWSTIWSKPYLEKHLPVQSIEYLSLSALGNTSGEQNWIPQDEIEAHKALKELATLCESRTMVLMCSELNPERCHRVVIAQKLSKLVQIPFENLT